jgi:nucleotide-binding universal stress UspA family protein
MAYAVMMVHVDIDDAFDARLRLAAALAKRFGSTLIGVCATLLPPYPAETGTYVTKEFVEEERAAVATLLARREEAFRRIAGAGGVKLEWRSSMDLPDDVVAREARAADLVIIGRVSAPGGVVRSIDPGRVALRAGRPALIVPPGVEAVRAERIVIGWKDTREARRAVQDALPLLHEAKHVRVVEIRDVADDARAQQRVDDVARYLGRHRIAADTLVVTQAGGHAGGALMRVAQEDGADLIVAGAFGQSRLGEWIFGGATRDLLSSSPLCCLLAH